MLENRPPAFEASNRAIGRGRRPRPRLLAHRVHAASFPPPPWTSTSRSNRQRLAQTRRRDEAERLRFFRVRRRVEGPQTPMQGTPRQGRAGCRGQGVHACLDLLVCCRARVSWLSAAALRGSSFGPARNGLAIAMIPRTQTDSLNHKYTIHSDDSGTGD